MAGLSGLTKAKTILHNINAQDKVPGMSITLLKKGEKFLQNGYGFANIEKKEPVHADNTIFRIASISKCITGLALGKMVEEGLVDWDTSFFKYVPYYPKKKYDFTLRQLAAHTAGIRGYQGKEFAMNHPYGIKESISVFKNAPLLFKPGKGYLYNSYDFVLLSLAMQEASGIPFEQYVKQKVLDPLDMKNTWAPLKEGIPLSAKREIPISEFYTRISNGFRKAVKVNNFYKLAGGGYLSTSSDVAKLGQAILDGKLLKKETYEQLFTPQQTKGESTYYGLGFQVSQDAKGRNFIGHIGNSVGAYSNLFVYPKEQVVISVLTNCTAPNIQNDLDNAIDSFLESIPPY
ncbi:MAG: serine hydrolase domain-containing protein [Bacteroidota bacterium]